MKTALKLAGRRVNRPVLNHVSVTNGRLTATNMEAQIECAAPPNLKDGIYHHSVIKVGLSSVSEFSHDDFPQSIASYDIRFSTELTPSDIESFRWVSEAASEEDARYCLMGMLLDGGNVVATDGHRLHIAPVSYTLPDLGVSKIVPSQALDLLFDLIKEYKVKSVIKMELYKYVVRFDLRHAILTAKLIDGTFPQYQRVIPSVNAESKSCSFDPAPIKAVIPQIKSLLRAANKKRAALHFDKCGSSAFFYEDKKAEEDSVHAPPFRFDNIKLWMGYPVGLNPDFLAAACPGIMYGNDSSSPHKIVSEDGRMAVIMPIRI